MSDEVILSFENGVRVIRFNRPKSKNAFNSNVYATVIKTLSSDAENDAVVMTILTGTGEYYSSGFDIKSAVSRVDANDPDAGTREVYNFIKAFIDYPKLLIALINGPVIGIAATTATLCDIIYASERATFQTPFVNLGLCAEGCSSYVFPRLMGRSKASEMLLLGKKFTANEMYQCGFISQVIPHEKLNNILEDLKKLAMNLPVNTVKHSKNLIMAPLRKTFYECHERELKQLDECFQSEECSNAIMKFLTRKSKL